MEYEHWTKMVIASASVHLLLKIEYMRTVAHNVYSLGAENFILYSKIIHTNLLLEYELLLAQNYR